MPFFEPPPPSPYPPEPPRPPAWSGAPEGVLGGLAPLRAVLVRSGSLVVVAGHFACYPTGFELVLTVRSRAPAGAAMGGGPFHGPAGWRPLGEGGGDDGLRFGVAFADGRKATNVPHMPPFGDVEASGAGASRTMSATASGTSVRETRYPIDDAPEPEPPLLVPGGGSGGMNRWDQDYWVWGLPPEGPLGLVVEWPSQGVVETRVDLDGSAIRRAAEEAEVLWDGD